MSRIAKADVNRALEVAAKAILSAGGSDGRVSRAEVKTAIKALPPAERRLVDIFFKFIDNRDFRSGAQVTAGDVRKAVAYAKEHLVAKYDLDHNGLSKAEISKMSLTGKRAVDLAKTLKETAGGAGAGWSQVAQELKAAAHDTYYVSETDSQPEPLAGKPGDGRGVTEANVRAAFGPQVAKWLGTPLGDLAMEIDSGPESAKWLKDMGTVSPDDDEYYRRSHEGFGRLGKILQANLTELRRVKIGPKDDDGSLASDHGAYQVLLIGKAKDGNLAGIHFEAVET